MRIDERKAGTLQFLDAGNRFAVERSGFRKLTAQGCDLCIYSLTPRGEKEPQYIIVKATMPGCMNAQQHGKDLSREARCAAMTISDYHAISPRGLVYEAQRMMYAVQNCAASQEKDEAVFLRKNRLFADRIPAHAFFTAEPKTDSPNADIYLQERKRFLSAERNQALYRGKTGTLQFLDAGNRFAGIRPALEQLTAYVCDVCVYSLTPKGKAAPAYLIAKVTLPGCMDAYLRGAEVNREARCVYMLIFDYDKVEPQKVYNEVASSAYHVYAAARDSEKQQEVLIGRLTDHDGNMEVQEFFSVETKSSDPNAAIYLRDGTHFINQYEDVNRYSDVPGKLSFLDDGKRFDSALPALQRLSERGCDVSVYSMVPAGQKAPGRLIIRVTLPGRMDRYWHTWKTKPHDRCIALEIVDYEGTDPAEIAQKARALREKVYARASALLKGASVCTVCIGTDEADIQAYFSLDAAPDTPNANTYRFDKHHFLDAVPVVHKSAPRLDAGETCVSAIRAMARRPRTFRNELVLAPDIVTDVTNMGALFESFQKITHLDLSPLSTAGVTNMGSMFQACQSLEELDCSAFDTSAVTDMSDMFCQCSRLRKLNLSSFDVRRVTDMSRMFSECRSLAELNLSGFDTAQVTSMQRMFASCSALETLNLSSFNTSRVTNMVGMFSFCKKLKEIDLSSFDTSNVTNMRSLFWGCEQLAELNLSSLNTVRVTNMNYMFSRCKSLKRLDLSSFDTSHVTSMFEMFEDCESLEELNLSAWNTSQVEDMHRMFTGCRRLKKLDLSSFDFRNVRAMDEMFHGCTSLQEVILSDTLLQAPVQIERVIKEGRTYTEEVLGEGNTPSHAYENRYIATITEGRETKNISISQATERELRQYLALGEGVKMTFGRPAVQKKPDAPEEGFWQKLFSGFEQR